MLALPGPTGRLWTPGPTLRALLDASPVPQAIVDAAGRLVLCNPAWKALGARTGTFGDLGTLVTGADVEGSAYARRLASLDGPLAPAAHRLARAIEDATRERPHDARVPYRVHRPDGEEPYEAAVTPLPGGEARTALVQHIEGIDRERAADVMAVAIELGLALEALRAERRRTDRRLQALGRDLHTPITPVRLQLHLLRNGQLGPLTDRQLHALEVIERNVARWAQGEEAFPRLANEGWQPPAPLDLGAAAAAAVEDRRAHALRQGVRLVHTPASRPLPVRASPDQLADVLDVLLERAIGATSAGATVAVEAAERDGEAIVEVRDAGQGLTPREVREAFEPWLGRRPTRGAGAPMALAYVRSAAVALGGRAFAESDGHGAGVLLGIAFPLEPAAAAKPSKPVRPDAAASAPRAKRSVARPRQNG